MKFIYPHLVAVTLVTTMFVTACSTDTPTVQASPSATPSIPAENNPTASPTPDNENTIDADDISFVIDGDLSSDLLSDEQTESVISTYTALQLDPYFMSGEWSDGDGEMFANVFIEVISDELRNEISSLDVTSLEESRLIASLAAVFEPIDGITSATTCNSDVGFTGCLASDIIITEVEVSQSDINENTVRINFTANTSRLLEVENTMSSAGLSYDNSIWYDIDERHIVSVQNSFTFDRVL